MITVNGRVFKLDTERTSYIFDITPKGHPQHIYYGRRLPDKNFMALRLKNNVILGSSVAYDNDPGYCLDTLLLEYSGNGKGDYRHSPMELIMPDGSFVTDFVYEGHETAVGDPVPDGPLPFAQGGTHTLSIHLADKKFPSLCLTLNYTVFEDSDVIARNAVLHNGGKDEVSIRKFMSLMVDFPTADYTLLTLSGGWAREAHAGEVPLPYGVTVNDSTVGASSNRHNPAFLLKGAGANESCGDVYGFNLIYSGNHYSAVEKGNHDTLRIMSGINPHCFCWRLGPGQSFTAPQAVMSFSNGGTNGLANNLHRFVNAHIIREAFRHTERPVVLNNWEATFFDFDRRRILSLAQRAKELGVELFVLDDGWFGRRNSDTAGLGDWSVNEKKLPGGIASLCEAVNRLGLRFGLWFEPECVNPDSQLYRAHPDWAVSVPGRTPGQGRNQLVLDLTRQEVRDYIVDAVDAVLSSANIEYVKWDYNRHISDAYSPALPCQGEFFHRYILGLYEVLRRIFVEKHPDVLLESCSSGGNRFDLGMLRFSPQIWTSDNTDAAERLDIQGGIYYFYPPSTVSNHVSMTPNQQTLRDVALSTRFNVAAFGVLGYELDFGELTPEERKQIREQTAFYKAHRKTFQYGTLTRYFPRPGERESWQMAGETEILAAIYNRSYKASPPRDTLRILSAKEGASYRVTSVKQALRISRFGGLIKHVSPVSLNASGSIVRFVDRHFAMTDGMEHYRCSGELLQSGIQLAMQYSGTGYNETIRVLGDWGSTLYLVSELPARKEDTQNGQTNEAE